MMEKDLEKNITMAVVDGIPTGLPRPEKVLEYMGLLILKNLTPHSVVLYQGDKIIQQWDKAENPARLEEKEKYRSLSCSNFPVIVRVIEHTNIVNLPEQEQGMGYIVSLPLLMGMKAIGIFRSDCVAPDTGKGAVRDEKGKILGTTGWVVLKEC